MCEASSMDRRRIDMAEERIEVDQSLIQGDNRLHGVVGRDGNRLLLRRRRR